MALEEARWWSFERLQGETLREALARTLRDAILAGALREGVRLPASRVLARQLDVSRGVVSDAYAQLEAQGFLVTGARSAPMVASALARPVRIKRNPDALVGDLQLGRPLEHNDRDGGSLAQADGHRNRASVALGSPGECALWCTRVLSPDALAN